MWKWRGLDEVREVYGRGRLFDPAWSGGCERKSRLGKMQDVLRTYSGPMSYLWNTRCSQMEAVAGTCSSASLSEIPEVSLTEAACLSSLNLSEGLFPQFPLNLKIPTIKGGYGIHVQHPVSSPALSIEFSRTLR